MTTIVVKTTPPVTIIAKAAAPKGDKGDKGDQGDSSGALLIANRLSELDTPQAKLDARSNLELQHIDCGEFL